MKLVAKLTAALVAGTFAVLIPNGYLRVRREVAVLWADRVRDHALLGRSLGAAESPMKTGATRKTKIRRGACEREIVQRWSRELDRPVRSLALSVSHERTEDDSGPHGLQRAR
jgi:hypothetical protein